MAEWLVQQAVTTKVQVYFPGGQNINRPVIFDIVNFCYKLILGKREGLFSVLVVWSASYASAKILEPEGTI